MSRHSRLFPRWISQAAFIAVLSAGTFSWLQFLYPPVATFAGSNDLWAVVGQLLLPINTIYPGMIFGGWLFLFVSLSPIILLGGAWRWVMTYIDRSQVAISVLETDVTLSFDSPLMTSATLYRRQLIHANQPEVRAYRATISTTGEKGELEADSFTAVSEVAGELITKEVLLTGTPKRKEMIEIYKRALPVNPILTYLPNLHAYALRGLFKRSIVERRTRLCQKHEYDGPEPSLSLSADRFPVANVTINIAFASETAPKPRNIRAFLIKDNIADEVDVIPDYSAPGLTIYRVHRSTLRQAELRVTWRNRQLRKYELKMGFATSQPAPLKAKKKP